MKTRKINLGWENKEPIAISAYAKKIIREKIPYQRTSKSLKYHFTISDTSHH